MYFLVGFPGKASEIEGADAASFEAFDGTYARDKSTVYFDGRPIPGADAASFELLDRPSFFKDRKHVYQDDRPISDDPAHFELLDGDLAKDSTAVYWSDGSVLSDDPAHFAIVSNQDHYLFTKDSRIVHVGGNPIAGAEPATFRVLQGGYAQDAGHIFYFTDQITDADAVVPRTRRRIRERRAACLLDGQDDRRRGTRHVPRAERRLRMIGRSAARLLPADRPRQRRSGHPPARPCRHLLRRDLN